MLHQGWWITECPEKTFLTCIRYFSPCYVLICGGGREGGRGRIREKKRERIIPSCGTTIKTPCQLMYLPKALPPNIITLGVKSGHNSIHSSYADLFLNQDRPSFPSLLLLIHFSWSVLGTRWTFHKIYIMMIWGKMIACEKKCSCVPNDINI